MGRLDTALPLIEARGTEVNDELAIVTAMVDLFAHSSPYPALLICVQWILHLHLLPHGTHFAPRAALRL